MHHGKLSTVLCRGQPFLSTLKKEFICCEPFSFPLVGGHRFFRDQRSTRDRDSWWYMVKCENLENGSQQMNSFFRVESQGRPLHKTVLSFPWCILELPALSSILRSGDPAASLRTVYTSLVRSRTKAKKRLFHAL